MKGKTVRAAFEDNNISQIEVSKIIKCHSSTISYQLSKENIEDSIAKRYLDAIDTILERRALAKEAEEEAEEEESLKATAIREARQEAMETKIVKATEPDKPYCPFRGAECLHNCQLFVDGNCAFYMLFLTWTGSCNNL